MHTKVHANWYTKQYACICMAGGRIARWHADYLYSIVIQANSFHNNIWRMKLNSLVDSTWAE